MNNIIRLGFAMLGLAGAAAHAQTAGHAAPDVSAGQKRAAVCFACHGADGIARIPGTPHLAGQERSYLEGALRAYRDGQTRQNPTMNAMARPLSDRDIVNLAAYYNLQTRMEDGRTAAQALETIERIRPLGIVVTAAPGGGGAASARSGEAVYNAACMACHASGAVGAPKFGDKAAWSPRLAQGVATLVQHALQGFKGMPARGGCANCSDAEIEAAVAFLTADVH